MAQIKEDSRQDAKANALATATSYNYVAAAAATAAGVASRVPTPVGAAVAGAAAITSGVAWFLATRYQEIANDPPRGDFDIASVASLDIELRQPTLKGQASWNEHSQYSLLLANALNDFVLSLERYDGAVQGAAQGEERAQRLASVQLEALRYNAEACAQLHEKVLLLTPQTNLAWHEFEMMFPQIPELWDSITLDEVRATYDDLAAVGLEALVESVRAPALQLETVPPDGDHPIYRAERVPDRPEILLGDSYYEGLQKMPAIFRDLVVTGQS